MTVEMLFEKAEEYGIPFQVIQNYLDDNNIEGAIAEINAAIVDAYYCWINEG